MKLPRLFLIAILLMAFGAGVIGQEPPKAILVDEFGMTCSEMVLASYDHFLVEIGKNASSTGLLVFYGDETTEGRNVAFYSFLSEWLPKVRQIKSPRLESQRGANQSETKVQFWLIPGGAANPNVPPYQPFEVRSTTRYDVVRGDFHKIQGQTYFYYDGFYELGCDFGPNIFGFSQHLRKNRDLVGYLVVYSEFGKGRKYGNRVMTYALNHVVKNSRLPSRRFKTVYGGERKNTEVEFWLVRKGDQPPILKSNKVNLTN